MKIIVSSAQVSPLSPALATSAAYYLDVLAAMLMSGGTALVPYKDSLIALLAAAFDAPAIKVRPGYSDVRLSASRRRVTSDQVQADNVSQNHSKRFFDVQRYFFSAAYCIDLLLVTSLVSGCHGGTPEACKLRGRNI